MTLRITGAQTWADDLALIAEAARAAGAVALGYFRQSPEVWWKNKDRSPVSAADFAANECLSDMLRSARPGYGWLSEETEDSRDRLSCETAFVIDPIDGTRAFIGGEVTWCVSVAVVHQGRPVAGALHAPALEEEYLAIAGGPALKNGLPIATTRWHEGEPMRLAVPEDMLAKFPPERRQSITRITHVPSLAYRLAMVAEGRIDGTLVKRNSHDWDLAAADLILECAGGRLTDLQGQALAYNRAEVSHPVLCGAAGSLVKPLAREFAALQHG
ncbi:3'(2'),5'-bisphosphate nucleotidase CysQ [Gellertiella hungarica]|uniref:Myo-inositol-1(Or 4)-monophosphatase n=1 Tax=Gellertiella hungarica TaxID=1572859 RepID=A0A7W6J3Y9_9HYPH|nr:3'(2'),5'-bisphosphate nucleotidase CysQ [Gellertiella hungarica]MBB4064318.1 myo-inositol-1(or 4)-monophosphatase [Gellertiella hungarica]